MDYWNILEIEPTVDIKIIKRAYAKKLKSKPPEDNPEFFQILREAYENALKNAKYIKEVKSANTISEEKSTSYENNSTLNTESTPSYNDFIENDTTVKPEDLIDNFMNKVDKLYNNFFMRIDINNWKLLLEDKNFWYIGIHEKLSFNMLNFLASHYNLPRKIWALLDTYFDWANQIDNLYKYFNKNFVNYIIGEITCPFELRYDFFKKDYECDYDKFISFRSDAYFALTDNNLEKAKISLDSAMNLFKDDPDLVRMFGKYYLKVSDYENAEVHFKHLIEIAPKEIDGYLNRGFLLLKLSKINEAYYDFEEALNLYPDNLQALKGLAKCYYELNRLLESKLLYEQVSEECPYDIDAKMSIIEINVKLMKKYKADLTNNPTSLNIIYKLADTYFELDYFEKCYEFIKNADKFSVLNSELYLLLANASSNINNKKEALKYLDKALAIAYNEGKNGYAILFKLGVINYELKNYDVAIKNLKLALKINEYDAEVLYYLAEAYRWKDEDPKALTFINKAISIDSSKWLYYSSRALLHYELKNFKESLEDHKIVLFNKSNFSDAWYRKGYCHLQLSQYSEAIGSFETAIDWGTDYKDVNLRLALCHFKLENFKAAIRCINHHCKDNSKDPFGFIVAGDIYRAINKAAEAEKAYYNALELKPNSLKILKLLSYVSLNSKNYENAFRYFKGLLSAVQDNKENADKLDLKIDVLYSYLSMISYELGDISNSHYYAKLALKASPSNADYKNYCIYLFRNRVSKLLPFLGSKKTLKENWPFENPPKYNSLPHLNVSIGGNYAKNL